ncbi:hypothetical protein [Desulfosporosinus sp. Sb-LF]|uniref:hypothetical protein n=1 Tax=Desulfosporosinus sp. Sb-LF TaxID=2560027 RepID=UPI00107FB9C6|nr:hypothetical protein [Desulfosporosinus sp. Sb-LF]TGE31562.1 hypothetical protein E4K68_16955 [Desulfosporosinus sp. Sb-LF]
MDRLIATRESLYEEQDHISSFIPFVAFVIDSHAETIGFSQIKSYLKSRFILDIPNHFIKEICRRGNLKGYFKLEERESYSITPKGTKFVRALTNVDDVEKKSDLLAKELTKFLKTHGFSRGVSRSYALNILLDFINTNFLSLPTFINKPFKVPQDKGDVISSAITRFIIKIELSNPIAYENLNDLVFGSWFCWSTWNENTYKNHA